MKRSKGPVVLEEIIYYTDHYYSEVENIQLVYSHGFKSEVIGRQTESTNKVVVTFNK